MGVINYHNDSVCGLIPQTIFAEKKAAHQGKNIIPDHGQKSHGE
jgi:hypothetical protein